jgi:glycosyltransferase involved in cell wall biosynthesis
VSPRRRRVVAMVTDSVYPFHHGGKEMRYREVVRRLSRDVDVLIFTMKWWPTGRSRVLDGVEYRAISPRLGLYAGERRSLTEALGFGLATVRLAVARFDAIEADHIPYAPLFVLRVICTARHKRFVVTWHEVWGRDLWRTYLGGLGGAAWWVERCAMLMPDRIIAASPETAERLRPYVRKRTAIVVAPNGLDLDAISRAPEDPRRTHLVFVGRLLAHKHVDLLLDAVARLARDGERLTARVIGRGPELPALRRQAADLGIAHLVEFRDDVDDQETLYSLVKAASVFVFPSVREGFGIAVLEALACGLPVITTSAPDNHAQSLVVRSGRGRVCEPSGTAVATAIRSVLAEERRQPSGTIRSLDPQVLDLVRQYDWDSVARTVAQALGVSDA